MNSSIKEYLSCLSIKNKNYINKCMKIYFKSLNIDYNYKDEVDIDYFVFYLKELILFCKSGNFKKDFSFKNKLTEYEIFSNNLKLSINKDLLCISYYIETTYDQISKKNIYSSKGLIDYNLQFEDWESYDVYNRSSTIMVKGSIQIKNYYDEVLTNFVIFLFYKVDKIYHVNYRLMKMMNYFKYYLNTNKNVKASI